MNNFAAKNKFYEMSRSRSCWQYIGRLVRAIEGRDTWNRVQVRRKCILLGNPGASWRICTSTISKESVVYSFGVGEDVSFDLELIQRFGVRVHAFDPTPRSIQWVGAQMLPEQFIFHPYGLAHYDGTCKFQPPGNPAHVSHTMLNRYTPFPSVEVPVFRLTTIMKMLGHREIQLLKVDIEGEEYPVLADFLSCGLRVEQLLVEFHHRWPEVGIEETKRAILQLNSAGYHICNISPSGEEYGFVR